MESFLKEQLKRLQEFAQQLSSLEKQAAEVNDKNTREENVISHGPLADVKDLTDIQLVRETRAAASDRERCPPLSSSTPPFEMSWRADVVSMLRRQLLAQRYREGYELLSSARIASGSTRAAPTRTAQ